MKTANSVSARVQDRQPSRAGSPSRRSALATLRPAQSRPPARRTAGGAMRSENWATARRPDRNNASIPPMYSRLITARAAMSPSRSSGGLGFVQVGVQEIAACGLSRSGGAYCWGTTIAATSATERRQDPTSASSSPPAVPCTTSPVSVAGGLTFTALYANAFGACGLTSTGAAYCWGENGGQLRRWHNREQLGARGGRGGTHLRDAERRRGLPYLRSDHGRRRELLGAEQYSGTRRWHHHVELRTRIAGQP